MAHLFDITKQREKFFIKKAKRCFLCRVNRNIINHIFYPSTFYVEPIVWPRMEFMDGRSTMTHTHLTRCGVMTSMPLKARTKKKI